MALVMNADDLQAFLEREFPQASDEFDVLSVSDDDVKVALKTSERHLRPGGTVSGPTMFSLVDVGMYLAVLARIGPQALAVTTNCSIDFMRKPPAGRRLTCTARVLKLGRVLVVGDAFIHAEGLDGAVARASLTYSIPPIRENGASA